MYIWYIKCVDKEEYRLRDLQRAMGRCDMAVGFSGKSPLSSLTEEQRGLRRSKRQTSVILSLISPWAVETEWLFLQQEEWYRRSLWLLSLCGDRSLFYIIGKSSELPYDIKSPPGRIALRRKGKMSPERPAAGGESCFAGFLFMHEYAKESFEVISAVP